MKNHFHSFASLSLMSLCASLTFSSVAYCQQNGRALCAPAKRKPVKKASSLPTAVRALLPPGAVSVSVFQLAPAPKEKPILFHLWTAARRDPNGDSNAYVSPGQFKGPVTAAEAKQGGLYPSPFVLDIFAPGAKAGQWEYRTTMITSENKAPEKYELRYLNAKTKEGYALSVMGSYGFGRNDQSTWTLYTFPVGWYGTYGTKSLNGFSDVTTPESTSYSLVRDANGLLRIKETAMRLVVPPGGTTPNLEESFTLLGWDSEAFDWRVLPKPAKPSP